MSDSDEPLPDDLALCHEIIRQQADTIRESQRRIEQLEHQVEQLLRRQYSPRRESVDPDQLRLFADEEPEGLAEGDPAPLPEPQDAATAPPPLAPPWTAAAPRAPAPRADRVRADRRGAGLPGLRLRAVKIGEEVSEQLEYIPASMRVLQHVRFRYACRGCQEHVAIAAKPPQPIDKGLPGPGLLAQTITSKYGDHLPLYRLEDIFARHGVELSRATLCGWMAQCAELLTPLFNEMVRRVLLSLVIHTDDTTVPVWDPTLPHTRTGRFWVYIGDPRHPYVVYDYTPRRTRDGPEGFLKGFRGYLQADAFSGYDRICAGSGVIEVACWAHVRRKFYESRTSAPVPAHAALARIRQLYKIEHDAAELSADDRSALRRRTAAASERLRRVVDRAGPQGAAQEPDRPGDRLCAVELGGAAAVHRARGSEHRK